MIENCFDIWADYAPTMRNAFKFKVDEAQLNKGIKDALTKKSEVEVTSYLPFESIYIQVERGEEEDTMLLLCERQPSIRDYPEMGLREGETFICITPATYTTFDNPSSPNRRYICTKE